MINLKTLKLVFYLNKLIILIINNLNYFTFILFKQISYYIFKKY